MTEQNSPVAPSSQTSAAGTDVGITSSGLPTVGEVPNEPVLDTFEGMGGDFSDNELQTLPAAEPNVRSAPVVATHVAAPAVPAATPTQASAPVTVTAPVTPQPVTPATTGVHPVTAESILGAITSDREGFLESLLPVFAISSEQALALEADFVTEVPKLLANTYLLATSTAVDYMRLLVPDMIDKHIRTSNTHRDAEADFFRQFPNIKRETHGADIVSFGKAFAAANPQIRRAELFQMIGASIAAKYGLAPAAALSAPTAQVPRAFTPAGSAPIVSQTPINDGTELFAGLGMSFD